MNVGVDSNLGNGRVLELQRRIEDLEAQERDIQASLGAARNEWAYTINKTSPINSFPDEILTMIFEAGHRTRTDVSCISEPPFEVTITHIIRRWRDVAIGTRSLWTNIDVLPTTYKGVATYLERSKTCSVSIRIGTTDRLWHAAPVALADVMAVITHQACRWHSFSVSSDTAEDLQTILRRLSNISAPFLTSLSFSYHTPPSYLARSENLRPWIEHGSYARILKGGAPLLSEVQLNGVMLPFCWPPLGAVERLCLDDGNGLAETEDVFLSYHQLRTALTASSSLDELSLSGCILHTWSTHQVPPISTPNLTVLSLHIDVLHLLFEFEAPRLRHLTLFDAFDEQFESVDDSALGVSGQGRFPALQSLNYITADVLGYRTWAIFFKACPSITDVSFSASKFSAEVALQRLGNFNIDAEPWPSLQTVTFFHSLPQPGILNGMLLHRIAIGLPLAKVRLGCELASTVGMSPLEVQIAPQIVEMHPQSWLKHHGIDEDQ